MTSERVQRRIDQLLDEADQAIGERDWARVRVTAETVLRLDSENVDAKTFLAAAEQGGEPGSGGRTASTPPGGPDKASAAAVPLPTSFVSGRYQVKRFLGEGGKKRVFIAHDISLDRDVAFALIKTEGHDDASRQRIAREVQTMGRLGAHPHIVTVYDIGEEAGQPYIVMELLGGGDVDGVVSDAEEHKLGLDDLLRIAIETCEGLEFAHSHGIMHRDLKPGNVWLTENGTAKVGDFGLAVAVDRSRLTQAGVMVGTVGYMPPEQTMGGEVTPQSDLYSLGCMLYEMVTGRPPFVGDESVAIIGQHLNTPPVAPTWHRPDCPATLEALILKLLEKDPAKRPESAGAVRQALESAGQADSEPTHDSVLEQSAHTHAPVYSRVFVGREREVGQLQAALDASLSAQGGLMMVVGEPGIGKTAITEQLATYAALRGGKTLVGHCYEEGSLSLPYLAFVETMRSYVLDRDPEGLKSDLGSGAADVARIVSEIRDRVEGVEVSPTTEGEEDRYRLLQAVSSFLRNAASVQPLLIVLEDLHWADHGTLDLLLHVARNLQGARLLIIGSYRDVEVDRAHPLSAALAELRRISSFDRVLLRGLSVQDVRRMVQALAQQQEEVRESFAQAVHRQTEGNPLFVQEVVRYVVEEGLVKREDGRYQPAGDTLPEMGIPEGRRDVIGKRLERLSPECNRVLATASVIGREFPLEALKVVSDVSEDELTAALEEAVHLGILQDQSRAGLLRFRFEHVFFRQTLYEEIFTPRRLRLHQGVARALEQQYASHSEEHAAELAEHFAQSIDPSDLTKAVHYGELAAQRAMSVFAFGEAVRLLERALEAQTILNPDDKTKLCDLLIALAMALPMVREGQRADEIVLEEAFDLAEELQDHDRAAKVCELAFVASGLSETLGGTAPRRLVWLNRLRQRAATASNFISIQGQQFLGLMNGGEFGEGRKIIHEALQSARELDDSALALLLLRLLIDPRFASVGDLEEHRVLANDALSWERDADLSLGLVGAYIGVFELMRGDRPEAENIWREVRDLREQRKGPGLSAFNSLVDILLATLDGDLSTAIRIGDDFGGLVLDNVLAITLPALLYSGQPDTLITKLDEVRHAAGLPPMDQDLGPHRATLSLYLAHSGQLEEAKADVQQIIARLEEIGPLSDAPMNFLAQLLQVAVLTGEEEVAAALASELQAVSHLLTGIYMTCVARHLGAASVLLGKLDEARDYYAQALEVCERVRFRPEIALTRLHLAELLLDHYPDERTEALEHLDFAISEFQEMKMQPSLEQALAARRPAEARRRARLRYPDGLTEREVQVLRLIASGSSNIEVADQLVLSLRTVESHITNIYGKIGARGRADATSYALRNSLTT